VSKEQKERKNVPCPECPDNIEVYWDPKYNGFRGTCKECGTNWAES